MLVWEGMRLGSGVCMYQGVLFGGVSTWNN